MRPLSLSTGQQAQLGMVARIGPGLVGSRKMRTIGNALPSARDQNDAMKPLTENRHFARVDRAARLLAERLDDPPSAEELARAVGASRFHFQRVFRAATGETVLDTLRRLRALKAIELLDAGTRVAEVAGAVGYETPQAFSRAFRQWTGVAPSRVPGRGDALASAFRRPATPEPVPLNIEITSVQPLRLTVLRTRRPLGPLNDVYETLFEAAAHQQRLAALRGIFGVPLNDPVSEPGAMQEHLAGLSLGDESLDGFETLEIEAMPALRVRHTGPFDGIDVTSIHAYRHIIDRELDLADLPALHHHLDDPDHVPADRLRTDLFFRLAERPEGGQR